MNILSIAIGGAVGSVLRYMLSKYITFQEFPIATLSINIIGSLFLGYLFTKYSISNPKLYLLLGIGFCGAFTTFSTFSLETFKLIIQSQYLTALTYILISIVTGLLATALGIYLGKL